MLSFQQQQKILTNILKNKSNQHCADCSAVSPTWASIDIGVFLCDNCSGVHRNLLFSITRVISTKLDKWQIDQIDFMKTGNLQLNLYWEAQVLSQNKKLKQNGYPIFQKPNSTSSPDEIKKFIIQKYLKKKFIPKGVQADPKTYYKFFFEKQSYQKQNINQTVSMNQNLTLKKNQVSQFSVSQRENLHLDNENQITSSNQNSANTPSVLRSQASFVENDQQFNDGRSTNDGNLSGHLTHTTSITGSTVTDRSKLLFEQLISQNKQQQEKRRKAQIQTNQNNNMFYCNGAYHFHNNNLQFYNKINNSKNCMIGHNINYNNSIQHHNPLQNYNYIQPSLHKTHSLQNPHTFQNVRFKNFNFHNIHHNNKNQDDWI